MKLNLLMLAVLLCHYSYSQDTLKVSAGQFATELNVNPFNGALSLNNSLNQIKVRYFTSDKVALRIGLNFSTDNVKNKTENVYGLDPYTFKENRKSTTFGLNFGIEKHFKGTKRLSPFIGGEVSFAVKGSKHTIEDRNNEVTIKGAWRSLDYGNPNNPVYYNYNNRAYFKYGVNAVAGFDYYVAKNIYLGYEFNFHMSKFKYKDIDISSSNDFDDDRGDQEDSSFSGGLTLLNGIRIGFIF